MYELFWVLCVARLQPPSTTCSPGEALASLATLSDSRSSASEVPSAQRHADVSRQNRSCRPDGVGEGNRVCRRLALPYDHAFGWLGEFDVLL